MLFFMIMIFIFSFLFRHSWLFHDLCILGLTNRLLGIVKIKHPNIVYILLIIHDQVPNSISCRFWRSCSF